MAFSIEQLSFELTSDALAEQERALAGLRTRAGTVLAAASVAGAFLGAETNHGSIDTWGVLALATFVLCLSSAVRVLLPQQVVFSFRGEALLGESDNRGVTDVAEAYRAASIWIEPHLRRNADKIAALSGWLTASCLLLAGEVLFWTLSFAG